MKVGIITIHNPPNYGAMLQAYALSTYLQKKGFDAEIVDYDQPDLSAYFRFKWSFPPRINNWLRIKRCRAFVDNQQRKSAKTYRSPEEFIPDANNYDALITGSDQVWFVGPVQYYDPLYFLDLPESRARKISYAASVGGSKTFGEFEEKVSSALSRIDHLAVRDEHSFSLVDPLVETTPTQVVDPTFLRDFSELLSTNSPEPEPYLLLFGNISKKWGPLIKEVAKRRNVKTIVTLQYKNDFATKRLGAPSPVDWINYFKHADSVITTYFHGTAFAINFQRPFISIPTPGRVEKVKGLLANVGLEERFIADDGPTENAADLFSAPIDWTSAKSQLDARVATSEAFLANALA